MPKDSNGDIFGKGPNAVPKARPPGTLSEQALEDRCFGCGDCASVCPQQIIEMDIKSFPVLTAPERCANCGLCADICMFGAIELNLQTLIGLARCKAVEQARGESAFGLLA